MEWHGLGLLESEEVVELWEQEEKDELSLAELILPTVWSLVARWEFFSKSLLKLTI